MFTVTVHAHMHFKILAYIPFTIIIVLVGSHINMELYEYETHIIYMYNLICTTSLSINSHYDAKF